MVNLSVITSTLLQENRSECLEKLSKLRTNKERVQEVLKELKSNNALKDELSVTSNQDSLKNLDTALKYKQIGNTFFQAKKYESAIEKYTEGIRFAPCEGNEGENVELAILLANRSACLFYRYKYDAALHDINASLHNGYPIHLRYKVYHRAGKCLQKLCKYEDAVEELCKGLAALRTAKLDEKALSKWELNFENDLNAVKKMAGSKHRCSNGSNSVAISESVTSLSKHNQFLHHLSDSLSMTVHPQFGRLVVAGEDIKAGDTLAEEFPFAFILFPDYWASHCSGCLQKLTVPYPCRNCISILYCCLHCEEKAWNTFHKYECQFLQYFKFETFAKMGHLAERICIQSSSVIVEEFSKQIKSDDNVEVNCQPEVIFDDYKAILSLVNHEDARDDKTNLELTLIAVLLKNVVMESGVMQHAITKANVEISGEANLMKFDLFLIERMLKHLQIIQCNAFTITEMHDIDNMTTSKPADIASAVYPNCSYFNHSCDPDIEFSFHNNQIVAHAVRDITKGEQVYCDYGYVFYSDKKEKRRNELNLQYLFECECKACTKNWPLFEQLESKVPNFKCQKCQCQLDVKSVADRSSIPCTNPSCDNTENLIVTLEDLTRSHIKYTEGMQLALKDQYQKALPLLISHLRCMSKYLCKPWREYYSCQATIKQCYRLSGNTEKR